MERTTEALTALYQSSKQSYLGKMQEELAAGRGTGGILAENFVGLNLRVLRRLCPLDQNTEKGKKSGRWPRPFRGGCSTAAVPLATVLIR